MLSLSTIGDAKVSKKKRIREGFDSLVKRHRNPLKGASSFDFISLRPAA